jgi:hypothetical protein
MQHLRFRVDNVKGLLKELSKEGIEPIWHHSYPEFGVSFAYVDSGKIGGVMFELYEEK